MDFNFKFNSQKDYSNFLDYLKSKGKTESVECKEKHKNVIATKRDILCLSMSEIRKIAKQISLNDPYGYIKYVDKNGTYEEIMIWCLVCANFKSIEEQVKLLDEWKEYIDCWALCDSACSSLKTLKKSKDKSNYFDYFLKLCYNEKEFTSRYGIVTLMSNYLEEEYIDKILQMCQEVKNDAYYVKMAIAWLLSFAFIKFKDKTYNLISSKVLDKFTQNKAISKCRDSYQVSKEDKEKLVQFRIK